LTASAELDQFAQVTPALLEYSQFPYADAVTVSLRISLFVDASYKRSLMFGIVPPQLETCCHANILLAAEDLLSEGW
jgi:hypothetical protein